MDKPVGVVTGLTLANQDVLVDSINKFFYGRKFNISVTTVNFPVMKVTGANVSNVVLNVKELRFCNREIVNSLMIVKGGQISIGLSPGGSIAWDINAEDVLFSIDEKSKRIWIQRFFENRQRAKYMLLTLDPI